MSPEIIITSHLCRALRPSTLLFVFAVELAHRMRLQQANHVSLFNELQTADRQCELNDKLISAFSSSRVRVGGGQNGVRRNMNTGLCKLYFCRYFTSLVAAVLLNLLPNISRL